MAKNEITWLSKWRLDGAEEKDSRGTERSDNGWCMVGIPEGCRDGHNGVDKEDAAKAPIQAKVQISYLMGILRSQMNGGNGSGS